MPNWNAVLKEIADAKPFGGASPHDIVRRKYLSKLHDKTKRNIIAYYSGFLSKPKVEGVEITDEDKNGFMLCVHKLDRNLGLDLLLHTPGGDLAATESLIHYLKEMFPDIRAVVPQIAMSAGTIVACACQEIVMGKHSNLGPVDPQFSGIPAIGVLKEIELAFEQIKADQRAALVWSPILSRLPPSFVQQCQWAIERSKEYLELALKDGNCKNVAQDKAAVIAKIVEGLTDLTHNKSHNRHFHYQDCKDMGLNIRTIEDDFDGEYQDLVLTVHHCFTHSLQNTPAIKIIESHKAQAYVKQQVQQQLLLQMPPDLQQALEKELPGPGTPSH
jgi:hypothetical protein